jgi:hypothetical protein
VLRLRLHLNDAAPCGSGTESATLVCGHSVKFQVIVRLRTFEKSSHGHIGQ